MKHLDSETCGLNGLPVIMQLADDDGPVSIYPVWSNTVNETLKLLTALTKDTICGFNIAFDWYHVNKLYNIFNAIGDKGRLPNQDEVRDILTRRTFTKLCLKPVKALDLMLHLLKTPYQSLMGRDDIIIRKVPRVLAGQLSELLKDKVDLPWIYFAKRKDGYEWRVEPCKNNPEFADVVLHWGSTYKLKPVCSEIFKTSTIDWPVPKNLLPDEPLYNPYNIEWMEKLHEQILYWSHNSTAKSYAEQDIILLQRLYHYWAEPEPGDVDSELAIAVACARFVGFAVDFNQLEHRLEQNNHTITTCPINYNSFVEVGRWLRGVANPIQQTLINDTSKDTLKSLCKLGGEVASRASVILNTRTADKENDILKKLFETGRFCPDLKVLGAKSGRMSGDSDLNAQGIPKDVTFRSMFTLASEGSEEVLSGGDFESFEVSLADAAYNDPVLRSELQSGKKFHALFGEQLFELPYQTIVDDADKYAKSKTGAFGLLYGAQEKKLSQSTGVTLQVAHDAYEAFVAKYTEIGRARKKVFDAFCSMRQPNGIGTSVEWHEPADYVESLLGFKRYFTLENKICKALFLLACNPPKGLEAIGKVIRTTRPQTPRGALQSALYSAAFQIQAANMRAAGNHKIQSSGAEICKQLQATLWQLQPSGVHPFFVKLLNIHDEILNVHRPELTPYIAKIVYDKVETYRPIVPLIKIDWKQRMSNWGEK